MRDERTAEFPVREQRPEVPGGRAEPVLEDESGVGPTVLFDGGDFVVLGERPAGRLLTPGPGAALENLLDLLDVQSGRSTDRDEVGFLLGQQGVEVQVRLDARGLGTERGGTRFVDVRDGHHLDVITMGFVRGPVTFRDPMRPRRRRPVSAFRYASSNLLPSAAMPGNRPPRPDVPGARPSRPSQKALSHATGRTTVNVVSAWCTTRTDENAPAQTGRPPHLWGLATASRIRVSGQTLPPHTGPVGHRNWPRQPT